MTRAARRGEILPRAYTPTHLTERILASRSALEGERKTVTALFCDIVGSTGTAERIGAEAMAELVEEFFTRSLAEIHRYEGTVTQFLGDGFLALFGAPLTHEDHAHRAVLAASAVASTLRADPIFIPGTDGALAVRMGLNSGQVVVGRIGDSLRMDYTAIGDTINLAGRLQAAADPGAVFLSESTFRAAEGSIEAEPLGARLVKGRSEPVAVHRLVRVRSLGRPSGPVGGSGSPLVGRAQQLEQLAGLMERLRSGRGSLVLVSGEAGVGKSRLMAEVRRRSDAASMRWIEGRTLSFGREIAYWPFLDALRGLCGISEDDGEPESLAKLEAQVHQLFGGDGAEVLPYLATLLGLEVSGALAERIRYLDGRAMGLQILLSVRRLFERLAKEGPVALVIEDLHWIDESSTELIEHLLPLVREVPLLIVCVSRPDDEGPLERLRALARREYSSTFTEVALEALSREDSAALLAGLAGPSVVTDAESDRLLERAEGNPFFLEEIVRWRAAGGADAVTIPETVQGVILARIDRLEDEVKEVLKVASVVGRTFLRRVIEAIDTAGIELDRELGELLRLELIRERRQVPELEYIFRHALVQEATYASIVRQRRLELHRRVGECIERLFADRLDEFYGLLAHHYGQAEDWAKAKEYLLKAADEAGRIAADAEALGYYRKAVETHAQVFGDRWDPVERAALERGMGEALFRLGQHEDATEHLLRASELLGAPYPRTPRGVGVALGRQVARQVSYRRLPRLSRDRTTGATSTVEDELYRVYVSLYWIDFFTDPQRYILDCLLLLNLSERKRIPRGMASGSAALGLMLSHIPLWRMARSYQRRSFVLAEQIDNPIVKGEAWFCQAFCEQFLGNWALAIDGYTEAERLYWDGGYLRGWGTGATLRAWVLRQQGDFSGSLEVIDQIERVAGDASDRELIAYALHSRAGILCRRGSFQPALDLYRQAHEIYRAIPSPLTDVSLLADSALCHLRENRIAEALDALAESEGLVKRHGFRGIHPVYPAIVAAEVHLHIAERASGADRATALGKAHAAARVAAKRSKGAREGAPGAYRVTGTWAWLRGQQRTARHWWERSLREAESLGARYDTALTELEAGSRLGEPERLERAETLFEEMGATVYADQAHEALRESM